MGLEVAAKELHQSLDLDIRNVEMSATFSEALNQLRDFIAKNFKADEIFAASSSKWR
jgi:ribosomal protein L31E